MVKAQTFSDPTGVTPAQIRDLEVIFAKTVDIILGFAGIALFLMLILGGFKYITSGGDPKAAESARNTLTYAIGGLVLIASAYLIIKIAESITGADLTNFAIFRP
ncbi:hypothetical protein A2685_02190 [Candidatus Woesebacteria bacterium RIFCSPHIGHO2_01_FULL_37_10]|uniref:Uncharacterized protein n=1 Tax=Candidatus Woesebacteria bacterium RIFCSPHIGHO2_01_FULL_37_10 TaxID=1802489 RepID=A0A1F7XWC3_9BACT|nr:MAG: hypothetical protein A2685_02190 [Candidatus Woesebacteria bacterium RIFCSPHIGHO2_01_FULL_37_10]